MDRKIQELINVAQGEQRCIFGETANEQHQLQRLFHQGELVCPYRSLYAESSYWNQLSICSRALHIIRSLHLKHPIWVFTFVSALEVYGMNHPWSIHTGSAWIADNTHNTGKKNRYAPLQRISVNTSESMIVHGIPVTSSAITIAVCIIRLNLRESLPVLNEGLRQGIRKHEIEDALAHMHMLNAYTQYVLSLGTDRTENGGEDFVLATIALAGFEIPQMQVEFIAPLNQPSIIRVDFDWKTKDGRVLILEFDGMEKYENTTMTRGQSVSQVVSKQTQRERALYACGATKIARCKYSDVKAIEPFIQILRDLGVPWKGTPEILADQWYSILGSR